MNILIPKDTCTPGFIAALFTIVKTWKQPKWPSTDNWLKKMWHNEILLNDKKEWNNAIYSNMDGPREYYWRRQWHPTPVLVPGNSHGRRSLVGCSPWGRTESDITERLHFHFSLSCTGEGNGNPLQCSCLENPRDGGSWWAAVYGVAQSRTRLKWLRSSSREYYA